MIKPATTAEELARAWWLLPVCLLGTMTSVIALPFYIIGPLIPMLEADFHWNRTAIVSATSFLQVGLVFGMPIAGKLTERFGGRLIALFSYGLVVAIMATLALELHSLAMLRAGYFALGLLCGGASTLPYTWLIGQWFERARGLALGVALAGTGIASFIAPHLVEGIGTQAGWRMAMLATASILGLGIPIILFGYREPTAKDTTAGTHARNGPPLATWRELVRDPRFVMLAALLMVAGAFISSMVVHFVPLLIDQGLSPQRAAWIASLNGIAMIFGRLLVGWLLDRYPAAWLGTAMFTLAGAGCLAFILGGITLAPMMVVAMGFMIGAEIDLLSYLVLRYFRLQDYAIVYGYIYGLYMADCIGSPWVIAFFIGLGGYTAMFMAAGIAFIAIGLMFPTLEKLPAGH